VRKTWHTSCAGGKKNYARDADRVAFLFARYQQLTNLLPSAKSAKPRGVAHQQAAEDAA
jgi:hypothetical protein